MIGELDVGLDDVNSGTSGGRLTRSPMKLEWEHQQQQQRHGEKLLQQQPENILGEWRGTKSKEI